MLLNATMISASFKWLSAENTYPITSLSSLVKIWFRCHEHLAIQRCIFSLKCLPCITISLDHVIILWKYMPIYSYGTSRRLWHLENCFIFISSFAIPWSVALVWQSSNVIVWCALIRSASFKRIFVKYSLTSTHSLLKKFIHAALFISISTLNRLTETAWNIQHWHLRRLRALPSENTDLFRGARCVSSLTLHHFQIYV